MPEAVVYAVTIALFSFVIVATSRMRHDMLMLACMPPVFVALVMGFIMAIYAWDSFSPIVAGLAVVLPIPFAWRLGGHYGSRDLLVSIYLAWAIGLATATYALQFPDHDTACQPGNGAATQGAHSAC